MGLSPKMTRNHVGDFAVNPQPKFSEDAQSSRDATAASQAAAQAAIDATLGEHQLGNYPMSSDRGEPA